MFHASGFSVHHAVFQLDKKTTTYSICDDDSNNI